MNRRLFILSVGVCAVAWLGIELGAAERLSHKFTPGAKSFYRLRNAMQQTQTIMGNATESEVQYEQVLQLTVDKIKENGNALIKVKVHEATFEASIPPLGDYAFDPKSNDNDRTGILGAAVTPLFELLNGAEYSIEVKPSGTVVRATGYGEMFADVIGQNPMSAQFIAGGSNEAVVSELQELFVEFSDQPVESGGSWKTKQEGVLPNFGKLSSDTTVTLQGPATLGDKAALRLDLSANLRIELDLEQPGATVTGALTCSGAQAELFIHPKTGQLIKAKGTAGLSGTLNVDAGGMMFPIESQQNREIIVERLDRLP